MMRRWVTSVLLSIAFAIVFVASSAGDAAAAPLEKVKVLVPDSGNLQFMAFWLAKAAGFFERAGIDVELVIPPNGPQQTQSFFETRAADVAVLPPPVYLTLIASKSSAAVLVANLLMNDPIEIIVHRSVLVERKLTLDMPLKDRVNGLRGLKMGVAPHPQTRARALFKSLGLDVDKDVQLVVIPGKEQNAAFHDGKVDALYAHTPFLEQAIVKDDAVVLVDQCRGEVPELANRQIHALVVQRTLLETRQDLAIGFVRAIAQAEALIHKDQAIATTMLARAFPERDRRELDTIVRIYEPAIPQSPTVRAEDIRGALTMFPAGLPTPDLTGIDLTQHVWNDPNPSAALAGASPSSPAPRWWLLAGFGAVVATILIMFLRRARREKQKAD